MRSSASWQFNVTGLYQFPLGINSRRTSSDGRATRIPTTSGPVRPTPEPIGPATLDRRRSTTFRLDNVYQLDLRLEKSFNIGPVAIIPPVEVFNVTNNGAVLQRYEPDREIRRPTSGFTQDASSTRSRRRRARAIMRLGARITF